ncbi:hypothetical protein MPSEU_001083000 [Mayamaea pseudoterrestris]|nr:hypothetical protein MPSEU_001083000 [Mayamaea pseudoterrestris]
MLACMHLVIYQNPRMAGTMDNKRSVQDFSVEEQPMMKKRTHCKASESDSLSEGDTQEKLIESKRAYNRMNAARARQRTKDQIQSLRKQLNDLAESSSHLQVENNDLSERLNALESENKLLRAALLNRLTCSQSKDAGAPTGAAIFGWHGLNAEDGCISVTQPRGHSNLLATNSLLSALHRAPIQLGPDMPFSLKEQLMGAHSPSSNQVSDADKKQALLRLIFASSA